MPHIGFRDTMNDINYKDMYIEKSNQVRKLKDAIQEIKSLAEIFYIEPEFETNKADCHKCNKLLKKIIETCKSA